MVFERYADVFIRAPDLHLDIHARLLSAVHGLIAKHQSKLAVAWPDWESAPGEFGFIFRVFGSDQDLAGFSGATGGLRTRNLVRCYPAMPVPAAELTVAYLRSRLVEKNTPGFIARQARRNERLGAPPPPTRKAAFVCHSLPMRSASTGESFSLFLERKPQAPVGCGGQNFGLGYTLPDF